MKYIIRVLGKNEQESLFQIEGKHTPDIAAIKDIIEKYKERHPKYSFVGCMTDVYEYLENQGYSLDFVNADYTVTI